MAYFEKKEASEWFYIVPSILLPVINNDSAKTSIAYSGNKSWIGIKGNLFTAEVPHSLHLAAWRLSNLIIADLIEDKLGYEKDSVKLTDQFFSDLGADPLDLIEIALYLEKTAGILVHEGIRFERISDLLDYVFSIMIRRIQKSTLGWPKSDLDILADW